jgi:hypothetical protein
MTATKDFDWHKDFYHRDPSYGLSDYDAVIGFIRSLIEDSEVPWCFEFTRKLILEQHTPLSQTLIQYIGHVIHDERGIAIIRDRLTNLGPEDRTFEMRGGATGLTPPPCTAGQYLEWICIQSLAEIGGAQVCQIVDGVYHNPDKAYLHELILTLDIAEYPRPGVIERQADYPDVLRDLHSMNSVMREDDTDVDDVPDWMRGAKVAEDMADAGLADRDQQHRSQRDTIIQAWRNLPWPGKIETLVGDGETTTFKLKTKFVGWIHNDADPFSDLGVFMSDPKVEYPIGRRRWSHSHTFLCFQIPDGSLWGREYTWDEQDNTITTHFREHVALEEVTVDADGLSVTVAQGPIATAIATKGNVWTGQNNGAVRGVWDNPQKEGLNYYTRRANMLTPYQHLTCSMVPPHMPIVQFYGEWLVDESEKPERFFDVTGECTDVQGVIDELLIPLHEPKILALSIDPYVPRGADDPVGKKLPKDLWPELISVPPTSHLDRVMGVEFVPHQCGLAGWEMNNDTGYNPGYDINSDGRIDDMDRSLLTKHAGEVYRNNLMHHSYYGASWYGTGYGCCSRNFVEHPPIFVICYDYGAGYDAAQGRISLYEAVEPGTRLYVEYYRDAPAVSGEEIKVYLHEPLTQPIQRQRYVPSSVSSSRDITIGDQLK